MEYIVQRGDQQYGPYTLSDLQRYVQSGNIALNDLAKSEGMVEWIPVAQVVGDIPVAPIPAVGGTGIQAAESNLIPLPPNLHWAIVLLLSAVSQNIFAYFWVLLQANWARKLNGDNKCWLVASLPAGFVVGIAAGAVMSSSSSDDLSSVVGIVILIAVIPYLIGMFKIKQAMEEYYNSTEKIGLDLSGVMTFFFNVYYFQYHINRIARWKKTGVLDGGRASSPPSIT